MEIFLQKLTDKEAEKWLELQVDAYMPLLLKYQDYETSPATETVERVIGRMNAACCDHYFIMLGDEIAGGVRTARWEGTTRYRLGGIFILPQYQNLGIGKAAMLLVESLYPDASSWELVTLQQEVRNLHFYESLGYRREGDAQIVNDKLSLVFYKKTMR